MDAAFDDASLTAAQMPARINSSHGRRRGPARTSKKLRSGQLWSVGIRPQDWVKLSLFNSFQRNSSSFAAPENNDIAILCDLVALVSPNSGLTGPFRFGTGFGSNNDNTPIRVPEGPEF